MDSNSADLELLLNMPQASNTKYSDCQAQRVEDSTSRKLWAFAT